MSFLSRCLLTGRGSLWNATVSTRPQISNGTSVTAAAGYSGTKSGYHGKTIQVEDNLGKQKHDWVKAFQGSNLMSAIIPVKHSFWQPISELQGGFTSSLLSPPHSKLVSGLTQTPSPFTEITRNIIKYSLRKGRRKTADCVKNRFYRLDWGGWISPIPGRARHLWKKPIQTRLHLRNHVFRSAEEATLLDKMCTKYWIKKKHFVDDPYENYHTRDNFPITKGLKGIDSTQLYRSNAYTIRASQPTIDRILRKMRPK